MIWLKQSTSVVVSMGPFLLFSDGVTLVTNLVGTGSNQTENTSTGIRISKNGGAFAARHATATASTYDAFGNYLVTLDTTDTNTLGVLRMQFANAAAFCPVWMDFMVVPANVWDSMFGSDLLDVSMTQILGTAVSTPATAGILDINVKNMNNVAATPITTIKAVQGLAVDGVVPTVTDLTNAPTNGDLTATMKTSVQTAAAAALAAFFTTAAQLVSDIWSATTRILTAGTNIVLAKGTGVTGFNDLSAAQVNAEADQALSDYDGPTHAELTAELATADDATLAAIAGLNNLSSAQAQTAAAAALTAYDAPTHAEMTAELATADDAVLAAVSSLNNIAAGAAMTLTSGERAAIAAAILDLADAIETGLTLREAQRLQVAAAAGKLSGAATTTVAIRNAVADSKDRITATVDANGNRTAVVIDVS